MTAGGLTDASMTALIEHYFDRCNAADVDGIAACFVPEGVHYFPAGTYGGPFVGAREIGQRWADAVARLGSIWTVDEVITDPASGRAVIEWTHFKTYQDVVLHGDEWYRFDPASGLIGDIRAYYATAQPAEGTRFELGGYDAARGRSSAPPPQWLAVRRAARPAP